MFKTKFSMQIHRQKNRHTHSDLRILNEDKTTLWSWALPKINFPGRGKKVLAIRTANHLVSYMYFQGTLKNGDKVTLFDRGDCKVLIETHNLIIIYFRGKKIKGAYNLIRMHNSKKDDSWIISKSRKSEG